MNKRQSTIRPSMKKHHLQRFWQIIFPIVVISLIVIFGGGYFVASGGSQTRLWADVSIIWLILPLLGIFLITLAIFIGMIILVFKVNQRAPLFTDKIQHLFERAKDSAANFADSSVKPVFWFQQTQSGIIRLFRNSKRSG